MTTPTNVRTWFGFGTGVAVRSYVHSKEHALFLIAAAVIFVHLLTQAFIDPAPMSRASDNIVTGLAGPALVALLAVSYPKLAIGFRAAATLLLGFFAVISGAIIHISQMVAVETTLSDVTAVASIAAGIVLVGMGLWLAWKAMPHIALKLAIIPAVPVSIVWLIFPLALATFIVNTPRVPLGDETPADYGLAYETVAFDNSDGDTLKGWYVPSGNGAAVILLHGAGKNRIRTLEYADIFARHGYGVLLFDRRGYGESEGSPNVFGWTGAGDVDAAVEFLDGRPDVDDGRIGALGLSVGGEIALNAIGENDGIGAVISEGAGIHVWSEYKQMPNKGIGEHIFGVSMFNAYTAIYALSGDEQPPSNLDLIQDVDRPILLISTGSGEEGEWNDLLMDEAGPNVDLWETGGGHIHGLDEKPVEYEQRVTDFLDKAFFEE